MKSESDRNIMLVDDEPDVLYTYKCFLSSRGYNVVTFTNPREALIHFCTIRSVVLWSCNIGHTDAQSKWPSVISQI